MITAADLMRWGNAGLSVPEEPVHKPPPPNFRGDIVKFTRRNGDHIQTGHMHREQIVELQEAGVDIVIEDDDHPGLEPYEHQTFTPVEPLVALRAAIDRALRDSDHYFLSDRDNIGEDVRSAWIAYRKALRAARALDEEAAIITALPRSDPKGGDSFGLFRQSQPDAGTKESSA
jgi:hypothetical protein